MTETALGYIQPEVGADLDTWGGPTGLNEALNRVDKTVGQGAVISIVGGLTLTPTQWRNARLTFTGVLTANVEVVFPTVNDGKSVQKLWHIANMTSGNFQVTCKLAASTGIQIPQSARSLIFSDGTDIFDFAAPVAADIPVGQVRLTKVGANLELGPWNGRFLTIDGYQRALGDVVTLQPSGNDVEAVPIAADTTYYIYASWNVTNGVTLEFSTTGHELNPVTAVRQRIGDSTRTLVGMARTITGPAWVDTETQRGVLSWFNRQPIFGRQTQPGQSTTTLTSWTEQPTGKRLGFLTWGPYRTQQTANLFHSVTGQKALMSQGLDAASPISGLSAAHQPSTTQHVSSGHHEWSAGTTEGWHEILPLLQSTQAGTSASHDNMAASVEVLG